MGPAWTLVALILAAATGRVASLDLKQDGDGSRQTVSRSEGGSRPARGGSGMFDADEGEAAAVEEDAPAEPAGSAEWQATTSGIAADMRAHLKRRQKKADADLIKLNRGPILTVIFGLGDFLRSRYFRNVRKSIGVFAGMWLWYVLNTKTYIPPEIEE